VDRPQAYAALSATGSVGSGVAVELDETNRIRTLGDYGEARAAAFLRIWDLHG